MAISKNLSIGSNLLPTESDQAKLGDASHKWVIDSSQLSTVPVANGGTGGRSASDARSNLSVYSKTEVDNKIKTSVDSAIGSALSASY